MREQRIVRSMRNNNPLNIRRGIARWQGTNQEFGDKDYVQFLSMVYGWRAAFILLCVTFHQKFHLKTLRLIVSRLAPSIENQTEAYTAYVARHAGVKADEVLPPAREDPELWLRIAWAMFEMEVGAKAIRETGRQEELHRDMEKGFDLAIK